MILIDKFPRIAGNYSKEYIMKNAKFTVEFITHVLSTGASATGKRDEFQHDSTGNIIFAQSWWYSALNKAIQLARVRGVKPADIHINLSLNAATQTFHRKYVSQGRECIRTHEAIMPGTKVEFEAIVGDNITQSVLENILDKMGKFVGLSPFGWNMGYGTFRVISVEVQPSEAEESAQ